MHNLALALSASGHLISGSDDEIYEPSRSRLKKSGLLPEKMGWSEDRITHELDLVIVGMHARRDNVELLRALSLGLDVHSFPSFIALESQKKKRIVIAGSHGKTTTTSMVMHVLAKLNTSFDYLVGAILDDFKYMVHLSEAEIIVLEGRRIPELTTG